MIEAIFHGHSFVEVMTDQGSILIDPFVTGNPQCEVTLEQLQTKQITHIIVTHGHADHLGDTEQLARLFPEVQIITVYGVAKYLEEQGVHQVHGFGIGGRYNDSIVTVKFFVAVHDGAIMDSGKSTQPAGVLLDIQEKKIYHAGDTALTTEFALLANQQIDLAFVPIGGKYTMDAEDALEAVALIKPKIAVPIHFATRPKIDADAQGFARELMSRNLAVPKVLRPGQAVVLS